MADGIVQLSPDSTGKKVDTSEITVGANTVERQRVVIADTTTAAAFAPVSATNGLSVTLTTALPTGANSIGTVVQQTLTKGTQGSVGVSTQDLKDAGRNQTNYHMTLPVVTASTDALVSLTGYKANAAVATTTTPAVVTTGKTYRITSVSITYVAIATAGSVKFTLRFNSGGVVAITSPAVCAWVVGAPAAAAGIASTVDIVLPDGLEFPAAGGIGVSMMGLAAAPTAGAIVGYGQIAINGFEY